MGQMLGVMVDCSRNAVMKPETLKKYITLLAKMGYNTLMLYTEDTYEVTGEPLFGYLRGRYTKAEIKEIDAYCLSLGIELIPCIQTLAHLNCAFMWDEYKAVCDCNDILLIDDERTYRLIENMFSSLAECFTTRRIHIGMDEAHMVGLGKYLDRHGFANRFDLLDHHLQKVCEIAGRYGFTPMMWSDMFFCLANKGEYYKDTADFDESIRTEIPENVSLVYWDYYHDDEQVYLDMIRCHKKLSDKIIFAGGAWSWIGFAPDNAKSIRRTKEALSACRKEGIQDIFFTSWGDDGAECSRFAVLPAFFAAAEYSRGNYDGESIRKKFRETVGADFDTFMLLDKAVTPEEYGRLGLSKALLYNDIFCGINDYLCSEKQNLYFEELSKELKEAEGKGEFAYLFDTIAALCDVLAIKCNLGAELRAAYQSGDKEALAALSKSFRNFRKRSLSFMMYSRLSG